MLWGSRLPLVDSPPRPPRTGPLTGRPCAGGPAKEGWALNTYRIMLSVHRPMSLLLPASSSKHKRLVHEVGNRVQRALPAS